MSDHFNQADLLRGGEQIVKEIYGLGDDVDETTLRRLVRRLYYEQDRWPIFQLDNNGMLFALRSRIRAHLLSRSAEKEARIAATGTGAAVAKDKTAKKRKRVRQFRHNAAA